MQNSESKVKKNKHFSKRKAVKESNKKKNKESDSKLINSLEKHLKKDGMEKPNLEMRVKNDENINCNRLFPLNSMKGVYNKFNVLLNLSNFSFCEKDFFHDLLHCNSNSSNPVKYKTEVCKFWEINKCCKFNKTCLFAHGSDEIRKKTSNSINNYKTKRCAQFFDNGFCTYGSRCQFLHEIFIFSYKVAIELLVLNYFSINPIEFETFPKRPRLKIFENITKVIKSKKIVK